MNLKYALTGAFISVLNIATTNAAPLPADGSVLPFQPTPSASVAAPRLQDSKHQRRVEQNHLSKKNYREHLQISNTRSWARRSSNRDNGIAKHRSLTRVSIKTADPVKEIKLA